MDYENDQDIILDFIDEEKMSLNKLQKRIPVETLKDQSQINFNELLERQWTPSSQAESFFHSRKTFHEINNHQYESQKIRNSLNEKANNSPNNSDQNTKNSFFAHEMKSIFTIFQSPDYVEDIQMYLSSQVFSCFMKIIVIINFIGLLIADYSFRLDEANQRKAVIGIQNAISLNLELFTNCVFTIEIILYFFSSRSVLSNAWVILNIIGTIACWTTIFFNLIENDNTILFQILHILRIVRGFRIIQVFSSLKDLFETFIGTLPDLGKIFFPLLIFMCFYAVTGQQLFLGSNEYKCRQTPQPTTPTTWPEVNWNLCGASLWNCPQNSYCRNPYDYGMQPISGQQNRSYEFNLLGFDNFFKAMLMVYHYVFMSNFTGTIFKFARYINPYLTTFYFVSMAVVLFYILANLVFVGLSKAYLEKQKILQKKKQNSFDSVDEEVPIVEPEQQMDEKIKIVLKIVQSFEIVLILLQSVVILIDYHNMPQGLRDNLSVVDFITTLIAISVVIIRVFMLKKKFLKTVHNFVDIIMILCFLADIAFCVLKGYSVIFIVQGTSAALRGIKIIRIIKILYISDSFFKYERSIVNLSFQTLKNMRWFLLMLSCILLIFSFIGKMLFSYRIRFTLQKQVDLVNGLPYVINFESVHKSIIAVLTLFENERWTETMYNYYHATGFWGVIFFVVIVFISHLLVTRLFMAVFFCYFRQDLEKALQQTKKQSKSQIVSGNNLQKKRQSEKTVIHQHNEAQSIQQNLQQKSSETSCHDTFDNLKNSQSSKPYTENQKLFWIFDSNSCFIQLMKFIHDSNYFYYFVLFGILVHVITIVLRSNVDTIEKTNILDGIENFSITIYCFQFFLGTVSYGFYWNENSYLKKTNFNIVNFLVIIFLILSNLPFIDPLYQMMIRRLIVIKVFTILKTRKKQMDIILKSIAKIFVNFLRVLFVYFLFILMTTVIPLKLLQGSFYNCINYHSTTQTTLLQLQNETFCMSAGGDWVQDSQNFDNIFTGILLMYQIVTSQSWTYFIEQTIFKNTYWDIYFTGMFFFYNICLLNIFVGLIVQTYVDLKDKAYKLNLLKPSQKGWILIKNCINELVPLPTIGSSQITGFVHEVCFKIVSNQYYNNFIDFLAYFNIILYAMTIYRSSHEYAQVLLYFKIAILLIFSFDALLKLYALRREYFYLDNSKVELIGFIYIIFYGLISTIQLTNEEQRIVNFFLIVFLFLRAKKFLFRFTWSKTLINSVIEILPKCIEIGSFLFLVLFVYVAIGLEVFKHVKPSSKADYYTTGFNNFYTGLMTLIKIASNQSWFEQVTTFLRSSHSNDICYEINNESDALFYHGMGCGTYLTYPFFFTYHITMSLLIFNLLIATMVSAYDENYEKQYNSVNVFQLQDCLQMWKKYDPRGTGVIAYKKFWKLSSQIGILFGISKKKLIKSKQKFLQQLDIPICQSISPKDSSVLCYRFHDVITKFSKIKLQVSLDKGDESSNSIEFDIHPMIQNQIKDYVVKIPEQLYKSYKQFKNYTSGDMKYLFGLLRKIRRWKTHSKSKGEVKVSKLSQIIKTAMEKKIEEQNLKNILAFSSNQAQIIGKKREKTKFSTKNYHIQKKPNNLNSQVSSDESQSQLVDSQPVQNDEIIEKQAEDYFDFQLNDQEQKQMQKRQKSI